MSYIIQSKNFEGISNGYFLYKDGDIKFVGEKSIATKFDNERVANRIVEDLKKNKTLPAYMKNFNLIKI